jgi:hypothetical protein
VHFVRPQREVPVAKRYNATKVLLDVPGLEEGRLVYARIRILKGAVVTHIKSTIASALWRVKRDGTYG